MSECFSEAIKVLKEHRYIRVGSGGLGEEKAVVDHVEFGSLVGCPDGNVEWTHGCGCLELRREAWAG